MDSYTGYIVETFVMLLALCALAAVVLVGARKLGVGRATGPIALVGQLPLDARRQIVLVRVGAQIIVVGVGEGGFTKLSEFPASSFSEADLAPRASSFGDVLARVLGAPQGGAGRAWAGAPSDAPASGTPSETPPKDVSPRSETTPKDASREEAS